MEIYQPVRLGREENGSTTATKRHKMGRSSDKQQEQLWTRYGREEGSGGREAEGLASEVWTVKTAKGQLRDVALRKQCGGKSFQQR